MTIRSFLNRYLKKHISQATFRNREVIIKHDKSRPPELSDYQNAQNFTPNSSFVVPGAESRQKQPKNTKNKTCVFFFSFF